MYISGTHVSEQGILSCTVIEYHMWKILQVKTRLAYHIAYYNYKNIIKSLYTYIQRTIKQEYTRYRHLL